MRVRLKVLDDDSGEDWVACGVSMLDDDHIIVMLMHDTRQSQLRPMHVDEWNKLEHHWFVDHGVADKPNVRSRPQPT